jgi:fructose-1,6-bisphosphatase/inositol monophosphatase family enzyme
MASDAPPNRREESEAPADLARALADVGRAVRDAVRSTRPDDDHEVVRTEGGDDVFGVDERAERTLLEGLAEVGRRWPGHLVMEGFDEPLAVGPAAGEWAYLADPVDGTRSYLAGLRSAWVLLGAGRRAATLEDLEVGAAVEIATDRAAWGRVAFAVRGGPVTCVDDDLVGGGPPRAVDLRPRPGASLERAFVTVVRHLAGVEVYDDMYPCTGGHLMSVASGAAAAVFDPRPVLQPGALASHPYDLAALVVYRAAGAVVEAFPSGPLDLPLDPHQPVGYAAYANEAVAARLRPAG